MQLPTISTVTIRACDLPDSSTIKVDGRWVHLYDATRGGQGHICGDEDITRLAQDELDERYVLLRVSADPVLAVRSVRSDEGAEDHVVDLEKFKAAARSYVGASPIPRSPGLAGEYNHRFVVAESHDLYEMQVLTYQDVHIYEAAAKESVSATTAVAN